MVTSSIGTDAEKVQSFLPPPGRVRLGLKERIGLSVETLARKQPVSELARQCGVSRKFVYRQADKARTALEATFAPPDDQEEVLFHLPVTQDWLRQFVLAQVLIGHTSFRGVAEIMQALLDMTGLSVGTIHNILTEVLPKARAINDAQDLSRIRVGAHDEIYQAGQPVLVGADVESTYCYLLALEEHCDEDTWGVHLLDLQRQGLAPEYTVADGGRALRAGQAAAWPGTPCHGDVFHAERELGKVAFYLENRAAGCTSAHQKLEHQMESSKRRGRGNQLSKRLALARQAAPQAVALAQDVRLLADWLQGDILSLVGPPAAIRAELYDFVVQELARREELCPHRIGPVRRALEQQRDDLLAFAAILDEQLAAVARQFQTTPVRVQGVCELEGLDPNSPAYWQRAGRLRQQLREKFVPIQETVRRILAHTPRASSVIENLNSRLRNYFTLRRELGNDYLDLLRFFLNHRCFLRSEHPERVGKSPAQLLSGEAHPHWLEILGFRLFHRN